MTLVLSDADPLVLSDSDPLILSGGAPVFTAGVLTEDSHTDTTATLSWTASSNGEGSVTEQLQIDDDGWTNVTGETSSPGEATELTPATAYDFRVAYTDDNETIYSNVVEVTTDAGGSAGAAAIYYSQMGRPIGA